MDEEQKESNVTEKSKAKKGDLSYLRTFFLGIFIAAYGYARTQGTLLSYSEMSLQNATGAIVMAIGILIIIISDVQRILIEIKEKSDK